MGATVFFKVADWQLCIGLAIMSLGWILFLLEAKRTERLEEENKDLRKANQKIWRYMRDEN